MKNNKEGWRSIPEWSDLYEASNLGNVRSLDRVMVDSIGRTRHFKGRVLNPGSNPAGYLFVKLCENGLETQVYVHHIIALAFIGKCPPGYVIHHTNGIVTDNRPINLEYLTRRDHAKTKAPTGRCGEGHSQAKLTEIEVLSIRNLKKEGQRTGKVAQSFSVSPSTICDIVQRRSWTHLLKEEVE